MKFIVSAFLICLMFCSPATAQLSVNIDGSNNRGVCLGADSVYAFHASSSQVGAVLNWTQVSGQAVAMNFPQPDSLVINLRTLQPGIYQFMVEGVINQDTARDTVQLELFALPQVQITGADSLCYAVNLIASGGISYLWSGGASRNNASNSFSNSGTYRLTVTDSHGCTASASKGVMVLPRPNITITQSLPACGADTLTASGGVSYSWNNGSSLNTAQNVVHASATYWVTVTNVYGCTATTNVSVAVSSLPVVTAMVQNPACGSVLVSAYGANHYEWSGGTNRHSSVNQISQSGTYTVTGTSVNGCTATATCSATIWPLPQIQLQTQNQTDSLHPNGSAIAHLSSGTLPYSFQWSTGNTGNQLSGLSAGNYCLTVTDSLGCTATSCIDILSWLATTVLEESSDIVIFPNPATNEVSIGMVKQQTYSHLYLLDTYGQVQVNQDLQGAVRNYQLELADLPAGTYYLVLEHIGQRRVKKLVLVK